MSWARADFRAFQANGYSLGDGKRGNMNRPDHFVANSLKSDSLQCRGGGTGRRAGLKIQCWQQREGSSPSPGTKNISVQAFRNADSTSALNTINITNRLPFKGRVRVGMGAAFQSTPIPLLASPLKGEGLSLGSAIALAENVHLQSLNNISRTNPNLPASMFSVCIRSLPSLGNAIGPIA
jgi:hypothetical protein